MFDVEIPAIKHGKSGLIKRGKRYSAIYYENGKTKFHPTGTTNLKDARAARDALYKRLVKNGARDRGGHSRAVLEAIDDPSGMACIRMQTIYRVVINGTSITNTTDKDLAIRRRNAYIKNKIL